MLNRRALAGLALLVNSLISVNCASHNLAPGTYYRILTGCTSKEDKTITCDYGKGDFTFSKNGKLLYFTDVDTMTRYVVVGTNGRMQMDNSILFTEKEPPLVLISDNDPLVKQAEKRHKYAIDLMQSDNNSK